MDTVEAKHILIVEDDTEICRLLRMFLENEGFKVSLCHKGSQAIGMIKDVSPDLIILDILLPGMTGVEICKQARIFYSGPILMLTACEDDVSEVTSFKVGADDYLRKPIRPDVLLAHIEALLRRMGPMNQQPESRNNQIIESGELKIYLNKREITITNQQVELACSEYDLLELLGQQKGHAVSREACFKTLRGFEYDGIDRSLDMRICNIRKKLGDEKPPYRFIKTVRGTGYMLAGD